MTREIPLTRGKVALVDDADYEWLSQWKWICLKGKTALYAVRRHWNGKTQDMIYMHRVITGAPRGMDVDHRDHNGLNNTRENIRVCTHSQNCANSFGRKGTSQFKGVSLDARTKMWIAQISYQKKVTHLGRFEHEIDAAIAYNHAAVKHFGSFARINDIPGWESLPRPVSTLQKVKRKRGVDKRYTPLEFFRILGIIPLPIRIAT